MGPLALLYGVRDRREVATIIIRLCQGDASAIKENAQRLGIGLRDAPFFAALSLLGSPVPAIVEEGSDSDWIARRHAATATRRLAYCLRLDEKHCWLLIEAGRDLKRGLKGLAPFVERALRTPSSKQRGVSSRSSLSSFAGDEPLNDKDSIDDETAPLFALVVYLVHETADAKICADIAAGDPVIRKFLRKSGSKEVLLKALAADLNFPSPDFVHFFLALSTSAAQSSVDSIVDRLLSSTTSKNISDEDLRQTSKLLLAFAHNDEFKILHVAKDSNLLRHLTFDVDGDMNEDFHPLIFFTRFVAIATRAALT